MEIVCATNMPFAEEAFSTLGDVTVLEGRNISAADVRNADILAIRSTTKVTPQLLEGSRARFVGTATIGTDHLDIDMLESRGIHWCSAAGCNANSVSEYLTAALLHLAVRHGFSLEDKTVGIVGVGNVGTRVLERVRALGMQVLANDPPRQRRGETCAVPFVSLESILAESDIVTLHVPLTRSGPDATLHMADCDFFDSLAPGSLFINAARGDVVRTDALISALVSKHIMHAVIDTWEGEPDYRVDLLAKADIGTPHIAGHSFEGKVMGTVMVYREACRFLGVEPTWTPEASMPPPDVPELSVSAAGRTDEDVLHEIISAVYDITADDRRLRETAGLHAPDRIKMFDSLRKNYPVRREFGNTRVRVDGAGSSLRDKVQGLGFMPAVDRRS